MCIYEAESEMTTSFQVDLKTLRQYILILFLKTKKKKKSKWTEVNTLRNAQLKNYNARVSRSLVLLHILNYIYLLTIYI
jgi:hypothetical protein